MLCRECGRTVGRFSIASDLVALEGNEWGGGGAVEKGRESPGGPALRYDLHSV